MLGKLRFLCAVTDQPYWRFCSSKRYVFGHGRCGWLVFILFSAAGLVPTFTLKDTKVVLEVLLFLSMALIILVLSLLKASYGVYMIPGAQFCEMGLMPLMFAFVILDLGCLSLIYAFKFGLIFDWDRNRFPYSNLFDSCLTLRSRTTSETMIA